MRNNISLKVNDINITNKDDVLQAIKAVPEITSIQLTVGILEKIPMHCDKGILMIYFDQLASVATHLQQKTWSVYYQNESRGV